MLASLPYWLHLLAAAAWIGPQLMMFFVVVPSLGRLDSSARFQLMRSVTVRFGGLGGVALAVLVLTGLDNIDRYSPSDMFDFRYGYILATKLVLVAVVIAITVAHSLLVGPKLLREQELALTAAGDPGHLARLRRASIALSSLTLLLSLAILFCAALLRGSFAYGSV